MDRAFGVFLDHLLRTYGNEVRAWRRGLDPKDTFVVDKARLDKYLRAIDFKDDEKLLWERLDVDSDESIVLEELAPYYADALASFKMWATQIDALFARGGPDWGPWEACADIWET